MSCGLAEQTYQKSSFLNSIEKNFEWGDYDSLLTKISVLAEDSSLSPEKMAPYLMYAGVAHLSKKDSLLALKNFKACWSSLPEFMPSPLYVNPYDYQWIELNWKIFQDTLSRNNGSYSVDSASVNFVETNGVNNADSSGQTKLNHQPDITVIPDSTPLEPKPFNQRPGAPIYTGGLLMGVGIITAGLSVLEWTKGNEIFKDFKEAAALGDSAKYYSHKKKLRKTDFKTAFLAGSSFISFAGAGYLIGRYVVVTGKSNSKVSIRINGLYNPELRFAFAF